MTSLCLGIDLGTTSVKVTLLDNETRTVMGSWCKPTDAALISDLGAAGFEQSPAKILLALDQCLSGLPLDLRLRVGAIGVCGQMHGVVLWNSKNFNIDPYCVVSGDVTSRLYTWQDARCSDEFLSSLPRPTSHLRLATGFGCATLYWLSRNHSSEWLESYNCAGTIQDMLVAMLCRLDHCVMSVQNAASWGYFNTIDKTWNINALTGSGFPTRLLPMVCQTGVIVGHTSSAWCSIPKGVPVFVAMGDLQCSVLPKFDGTKNAAALNISTSAQLVFRMPLDFLPQLLTADDINSGSRNRAIEYFPFFRDDSYLAVAASLTGGNVLVSFVRMILQWMQELDLTISETEIWKKLHQFDGACDTTLGDQTATLSIIPTIFGERHAPYQRGSVSGVTTDNTSLRNIYRMLSRGIITNLCEMMPAEEMRAAGIEMIIGGGTALVCSTEMRRAVSELFGMPLVISACQSEHNMGVPDSMGRSGVTRKKPEDLDFRCVESATVVKDSDGSASRDALGDCDAAVGAALLVLSAVQSKS